MIFQLTALILLGIFYGCYFGKMIAQKRKGIQTDQIGKGQKDRTDDESGNIVCSGTGTDQYLYEYGRFAKVGKIYRNYIGNFR